MALTIKQITHAKAGRLSDGKGLYLLVSPSGSKSWVLRVMYQGHRRDYGLGSVVFDSVGADLPLHKRRALTLSEARDKAREGRALAKAGLNPSVVWRQEPEHIPTFADAAREYHKSAKASWNNGKHGDQWINTLEAYAFPTLGKLRVDEIDATAIEKVLLPIWLTKGETARRVKQRIAAVLDYAHAKGWRPTEAPMRAVNKLLSGIKQQGKGHFPAMPYKDLPEFMAKLRAAPFSVGNRALQMCILTATRSGELRKAHWRDFRLEDAEWWLDPTTTKKRKPHLVPLVPAALEILAELKEIFGADPDTPVFPGLKGKPLSDATMAKVLRTHDGKHYTVHGFRSTFRDWAAETGFADAWAEAAISHKNPDRVVAAYKRTTFFDQRRDKLMPAWASFAVGEHSNVVQFVKVSA